MADEVTVIGIGVDTTDVSRGVAELDKLTAAGQRAENAAQDLSTGFSKVDAAAGEASRAVAGIGTATGGVSEALGRTQTAAQALAGAVGSASTGVAGLVRTGDLAAASLTKTQTAANALAVDLNKVGTSLGATGFFGGLAELERAGTSLGAASAQARNLGASIAAIDTSRLDQLGTTLGATSPAIRGTLDGLQKLPAATKPAEEGLKRLGVSAGQTRAAFAQLPAQITDVFTSLAGGQNPLLVLIQQGGQIKDSFGGIGAAARALATVFTPLRIAAGGAAAAVGAIALAAIQGDKESAQLARSLAITGNAAGLTEARFNSLAETISKKTNTAIGATRETLQSLAGSGRLSGEALALAAEGVQRLSLATGDSAENIAKQFGSLTDNVAAGALQLNKTYNFLNAEQLRFIRQLEDQGSVQEAVAQTLRLLNAQIGDQSQNLGTLEAAWKATKNAVSDFWDFAKSLGRDTTLEDAIARQEVAVRSLRAASEGRGFSNITQALSGTFGDGNKSALADAEALLAKLRESASVQKQVADASAESSERRKADIRVEDLIANGLSKQAKFQKEIADTIALLDKAGASPERRAAAINAVTAKYAEQAKTIRSTGDVFARVAQQITEATAAAKQEADQTASLTPLQRIRLDIYSKLSTEYTKLRGASLRTVAALLDEGDAVEALAASRASEAKFMAQAATERARYLSSLDGAVASQQREVEQLREQIIGFTSGKEALEAYRLAKLEDTEAELLRKEAIERGIDGDSEAADRYQKQAKALRELINLRQQLGSLETVKAGDEAADKAATALRTAYEREYDRITQGLTDALIKGGKSFADYIKGLFRTLVLRPIIDPIVRTVAGVITGGASGSAFAGGGGGSDVLSLASAVNKLSSIGDTISNSITSSFANFSTSSVGQSLGLSTTGLAEDAAGNIFTQTAPTAGAEFAGAALGAVGNAAAGYAIGQTLNKAISDGFTVGSGYNKFQQVGTAVASAFLGPIAGALIGGLTGIVNRVFGRRLEDVGIEGTLGGANGFQGNSFEFLKGGLFRSDKTNREALDPALNAVFTQGSDQIKTVAASYAEALGLPVDGIRSYTEQIKLSLKDLSDEQVQQKIAETISAFGENLVKPFAAQLAPFTRAGESASDTLARLADAITGVNPVLRELGVSLLDISVTGADAASKLIDAFGGAGNFASLSSQYYERFFTEQERAARGTEILREQFASYGAELPKTRQAFRDLVESQDLTTEGGRKAFAALLGVAGAFDEILTVTQGAEDNIESLAQALSNFTASLAETIEATRLRTLTPAARVADLRRQETDLFGQLATTTDPATVAEKLQRVILDRIREEASISEELRQSQIDTLQTQITAFERLRDIARDLTKTTAELSFSDLSPLNFADQLEAARNLFEQTITGAASGDVNAAQNLGGALQAYLEEARQFFGSDANFAAIFQDATGRVNALARQGEGLGAVVTDAQAQLRALEAVQDTSQQELDALLSLQAALREREAVAAKAATDQAELLKQQVAQQQATNETLQAQITQTAAIAEAQLAEARALNESVSRLVGNSTQAINAGIEP